MKPIAHPLFFASPACIDFIKPNTAMRRESKSLKLDDASHYSERYPHDIKARVHRNLTKKTKFDANKWLAENQGAYRLFKQFTLQAIESGVTRLGAKAVAERIRWESSLRKTTDYKMNNNAVAEMARRFMADYPEYAGIFATRVRNA